MEKAPTDLFQITTRVDGTTLRRLDELCEAEKRSRSFVLMEALEERLTRETEKAAA